MSNDLKDMAYGVPDPVGKITVQEIPIETKVEVENVRYDMVIDYGETITN